MDNLALRQGFVKDGDRFLSEARVMKVQLPERLHRSEMSDGTITNPGVVQGQPFEVVILCHLSQTIVRDVRPVQLQLAQISQAVEIP